MRIFRRISDILAANLNEMVEQWEDPERMLRQAVRELESAITQTRRAAVAVVTDEKLLARQIATERAALRACQSWAERAVRQGNDAMARQVLRHKATHERTISALEDQHRLAALASTGLRRRLETMRGKLADAQRRLAAAAAQRRAIEAQSRLRDVTLSGSEAITGFETFEWKLDRFEAETAALAELGDPLCEEFGDFSDLEATDIEAELEALKKSVQLDKP